jgi:hypothetical protein
MANGVDVPFFTVTSPPEPPRWSAVFAVAHDVIGTTDVAVSAPSFSPT